MRKLSDTLNLYILLLTEKQCLILLGDRPFDAKSTRERSYPEQESPAAREKVVIALAVLFAEKMSLQTQS